MDNSMASTESALQEKIHALQGILAEMGPTLVAFSGGVDSSFLLAVAAEILGDQVVALMTVSPATPPEDIRQATSLVDYLQVHLLTISHNELAIPEYATNPINRCYFCKHSLYEICRREAAQLSLRSIADGVNLDDLQDYRPGLYAATEYEIRHPLVEAQFHKQDIRRASRMFGLSTWEKPASPCLSSRVPYGTAITAAMLTQIARGEALLRELGFRELRVRHHGRQARIEINAGEFAKISPHTIQTLTEGIKRLGFTSVLLDMKGLRSGVFNEELSRGVNDYRFS